MAQLEAKAAGMGIPRDELWQLEASLDDYCESSYEEVVLEEEANSNSYRFVTVEQSTAESKRGNTPPADDLAPARPPRQPRDVPHRGGVVEAGDLPPAGGPPVDADRPLAGDDEDFEDLSWLFEDESWMHLATASGGLGGSDGHCPADVELPAGADGRLESIPSLDTEDFVGILGGVAGMTDAEVGAFAAGATDKPSSDDGDRPMGGQDGEQPSEVPAAQAAPQDAPAELPAATTATPATPASAPATTLAPVVTRRRGELLMPWH
jgi:hypothetical protein